MFELALKNIGNVSVYNVELEVNPKYLPGVTGELLRENNLFKKPIPVLLQNQEIRTAAFSFMEVLNLKQDMPIITFTIKYKTLQGKWQSQLFTYDLNVYYGLVHSSEATLNDVTEKLELLSKHVKGVVSNTKDVSKYLNWGLMIYTPQLYADVSITDVLNSFVNQWNDFRSMDDQTLIGFSYDKMHVLCEVVYNKLCQLDIESDEYIDLRRTFLKMSRHQPYRIREVVNEFIEMGDKAVSFIKQEKEKQHLASQ